MMGNYAHNTELDEKQNGGRFQMIEKLNLTMLTDYYEITMANGYFQSDLKDHTAVFDLFFRRVPDDGGYAIMAGLEQALEYVENLHFSEEDLDYLRSLNIFG